MTDQKPNRLRRAIIKGAGFAGAAAVISACDGGGQPSAQDGTAKSRTAFA